MGSRSLQDDLMRIPGVEGAEVEGSGDKPAGLRIRIAEGADQHAVGSAIRRVLTEHGLGTDTRLPGEDSAVVADDPATTSAELPAETPAEADVETETDAAAAPVAVLTEDQDDDEAAVIDLTDHAVADEDDDVTEDATADTLDEAPILDEPPGESEEPEAAMDAMDSVPEPLDARDLEAVPDPAPAPPPMTFANDGPSASAPSGPTGFARIESVAVAEGRDGIVITVSSSDGRSEQQIAASTEGGVESAVVRATARLALPDAPEATVVDIEDRRVAATDIVMIVLDVDGHMAAGSSVVHAGRPFARGRAPRAALTL